MNVFPYEVNWGRPYEVTLEYLTKIFASRNMTESRRAARSEPRETINFSVHNAKANVGRMSTFLRGTLGQDFILADPTLNTKLAVDASPLGLVLELEDEVPWAAKGLYIMAQVDGAWLPLLIESVTGSSVTLAQDLSVAIPAGAKVRRGFVCIISNQTALAYPSSRVATLPVSLDGRVGRNYVRAAKAPETEYEDLPVFDKRPNWSGSVTQTFTPTFDLTDFTYGRRSFDAFLDFVPQTSRANYVNRSPDFTEDLIGFFTAQKGRRGEFFAPSWTEDIPVAARLLSGLDRISCEGTEIALLEGNPIHTDIYVLLKNGNFLYRKIVGYQIVGDNTEALLDAPWDETYELSEIAHIGWLTRSRLSVDALSISWLTESVSTSTLAFQLLRP